MTAEPTLRILMMRRYEWLYDQAFSAAAAHGYGFVTPAMARVFSMISEGPIGLSDLARRLAISRQSLHETITAACDHGLVELVADAKNRRIRLARFTDAGKRMSRAVVAVDRRIEAELARAIGADNLDTLKSILAMPWPPIADPNPA